MHTMIDRTAVAPRRGGRLLGRFGRRAAAAGACLGLLAAAVPAVAGAAGGWAATQSLAVGAVDPSAPEAAAGRDGRVAVVWTDFGGSSSTVNAALRAPDGSLSGPDQLASAGQPAEAPQVAVGANGTAIAVWRRYDGANWRIQAAQHAVGGGWSAPKTLSAAGQDADDPSVAFGPSGEAIAIWQRFDGSVDVVQVSRRNLAGTWSSPANLSSTTASADDPRLAFDGHGNATAIWVIGPYGGPSTGIGYAYRTAGDPWGAPRALDAPAATRPALDVSPGGRAVAVWLDGASNLPTVRAATRMLGRAWSAPVALGSGSPFRDQPGVAVDDEATATSLWTDGSAVWSSRLVPGGSWSPAELEAGPATADHARFVDARFTRVAAGRRGETLAAWTGTTLAGTSFLEAITRTATASWTAPVEHGDAPADVAIDARGDGVVAWLEDGSLQLAEHQSGGAG